MTREQLFEEWIDNTDPTQAEEKAMRYFAALSRDAWGEVLRNPENQPVRIDVQPLDLNQGK